TPPAFILSQDQTLHLKVFARPRPKPAPFDSSKTLFSTNRPWFSLIGKPGKDVWHALLSFQGTGSPGADSPPSPEDGAVPPALPLSKCPEGRTFSISDTDSPVKRFFRPRRASERRQTRFDLRKNRKPRREAQSRASDFACQEISKKTGKA